MAWAKTSWGWAPATGQAVDQEGRRGLHPELVALVLILLQRPLGVRALHVRPELLDVIHTAAAGHVDDLVLGERRTLTGLGVQLVVQLPELALLSGGPGGTGGPLGVRAEDGEVTEFDAQGALVDELLDQCGLGLPGEAAAERALVVGVFDQDHRGVLLADGQRVAVRAPDGPLGEVVEHLLLCGVLLGRGGGGCLGCVGAAGVTVALDGRADGDGDRDHGDDEGDDRADGGQFAGGRGGNGHAEAPDVRRGIRALCVGRRPISAIRGGARCRR